MLSGRPIAPPGACRLSKFAQWDEAIVVDDNARAAKIIRGGRSK